MFGSSGFGVPYFAAGPFLVVSVSTTPVTAIRIAIRADVEIVLVRPDPKDVDVR